MNRLFFLTLFSLLFAITITAQKGGDSMAILPGDSLHFPDTTLLKDFLRTLDMPDSILKRPRKDSGWQPDIRQFHGKEPIFYLLLFLLVIYALLLRIFPKYFNDLFRLIFRTTIKQRQIREQLMQNPLPSLLLNGFFVVSGGLYISLLLQKFKSNPVDNFWLMFLYAGLGLSTIYFIKFLGLKISGWIFNMQETANSYIFIVFVINKMLGLLLLPFLILLAFTQGIVYPVALALSFCMVAGLLAYRFILSYAAIRNQVKVNPFHFFLYLIAIEFAPLLLIYKGLLLFFRITA